MAEENQVQQVTKEPHSEAGQVQRVTTKDMKKVAAAERLAECNHKKREVKKREEQVQLEKSGVNQYYGIRAVIALGVIGGLGYYIYQSKKGEVSNSALQAPTLWNPPQQPRPQVQPQTNKFEID